MLRIKIFLVLLTALTIYSCSVNSLETDNSKPEKLDKFKDLPDKWINLNSNEWRNELNIANDCDNLSNESELRLKEKISIDKNHFLLTLTCKLGSYQDAYYVYLIDSEKKQIRNVTFEIPQYQNTWNFHSKRLIWGSINKQSNDTQLEIINLSSATGMCGYQGYYAISSILASSVVKLHQAKGDHDCYNSVTVESWPIIKN